MVELGELEKWKDEFAKRRVRVVAVSADDQVTTDAMAGQFPSLTLVADPELRLIRLAGAVHEAAGPGGKDIAAPTILFIDASGVVQDVFRADTLVERLYPGKLLHRADVARGITGS